MVSSLAHMIVNILLSGVVAILCGCAGHFIGCARISCMEGVKMSR